MLQWMEITVSEPEKRSTTAMKMQDTYIVYLVETRYWNFRNVLIPESMYNLSSENKGAGLGLCFCICNKQVFS